MDQLYPRHANGEVPAPVPPDPEAKTPPRSCNRHDNCDEADKLAEIFMVPERAGSGSNRLIHCHDEACEDCHGH